MANGNAGTTSTTRPPGRSSPAKLRNASTSSGMCSSTLYATTAEYSPVWAIGTDSSRDGHPSLTGESLTQPE